MKKCIAALLVLTLLFGCTAAFAVDYTDKDTVKKAQQALNDAGYDCGRPDGIAGKNTKKAITSYQQDNGLEQTGTVNDALLVSLGLKEETNDVEEEMTDGGEEAPDAEEKTTLYLYGADVPAIEEVFPGLPITLPETAEELHALFDIDDLQIPVLDYRSIYADLMDDGKASFEAPEGLIDFGIMALYAFSNGEAYVELALMDDIKDGVATCTAEEDWLGEEFLALSFWMTYQTESHIENVTVETDALAEMITASSSSQSVIEIGLNRDFVGAGLVTYKEALMEYPLVTYSFSKESEGEEGQIIVNFIVSTDVLYDADGVIMRSTVHRWMRSFDASGNPIDGSDQFLTTDPSYAAD